MLKGRIDCTIPQRQYENIKIMYQFDGPEEKEEAIKAIIEDCIKYHDCVGRYAKSEKEISNFDSAPNEVLNVVDEYTIEGKDYRLRKKNGKLIRECYNKEMRLWEVL